jgi:esterase/lipase superfamily enzyme
MNREYHKWHSPRLGREMELLRFGHSGLPVLVFPTSMGTFFEFEDRGMVATLSDRIDAGALQLFCVDSVDKESWYNRGVHPAQRAARHMAYDAYIHEELLPLMRRYNGGQQRIAVTGASFGGYHCTNYALRHPDAVCACVSMSGAYDIRQFLGDYYDQNCYFSNPVDYLPALTDEWYLGQYRHDIRWIFGAGEHDICLNANRHISDLFNAKGIPHWFDYWGLGAVHDWPLWHLMARKYFG